MSGVNSLLARALLGLFAAAVTLALPRFRRVDAWGDSSFRRRYLFAFAGIRLLLFSLVFLVLHISPRGDLPGIYLSEFQARLAGGVPYRDYASSYAPLFSYLYAPVYRLGVSPLTVILFSIAIEVLTAAIFLRFMPRVLTGRQTRLAALLCLFNPISLQFVTIDGQNNVLIGLALALALLWLADNRAALSGASVGLSIASVKFLPLLFTPVFPLFLRKRATAWIAGCAAVVAAVYGYFQLVLHAPVLQAVEREGGIKTAGGLPFLVETVSGFDLGRVGWDTLLLLALAAVLAVAWQLARHTVPGSRGALAAATFLLPSLLLTMMALGKKTWPTYTEMVLFPTAMAVAAASLDHKAGDRPQWSGTWLLAAFSLLSVTAHSVWASLLGQATAKQVHALLAAGSGPAWLFLLLEVALLGGYAALVWVCLAQSRRIAATKG